MSLLFNMLSRFVRAFLSRSKCLLISWLQSPSAVIWKPEKLIIEMLMFKGHHTVYPPREGHGNPLQYSCLENPMDRRAWRAPVRGIAEAWTWLQLRHNPRSVSPGQTVPWWTLGHAGVCSAFPVPQEELPRCDDAHSSLSGSCFFGGDCLNFYKHTLLLKFKLYNAYVYTHIYVENIF